MKIDERIGRHPEEQLPVTIDERRKAIDRALARKGFDDDAIRDILAALHPYAAITLEAGFFKDRQWYAATARLVESESHERASAGRDRGGSGENGRKPQFNRKGAASTDNSKSQGRSE